MVRNWLKTAALAVALLAATAGVAAAAPIRAEIVTVEGQIIKSAAGHELDGWSLTGDTALLDQLTGQQVWVLGTSDELTGPKQMRVDRIERPVAINRVLPKTVTMGGKEIKFDQAPFMQKGTLMLPLRALVEATGGRIEWRPESQSAYLQLIDRSATFTVGQAKAEMYLYAARYMQQNFLAMDQRVVLRGGRMFVSADALTTVLGMTEQVTGAESVLALRFPAYQFDVAEPAPAELSYSLEWFGNRLQITGKAAVPDLQFKVLLDGKVIAEADTTVKEGQYIANVLVEGGREQAGRLELQIVDPRTGGALATDHLR